MTLMRCSSQVRITKSRSAGRPRWSICEKLRALLGPSCLRDRDVRACAVVATVTLIAVASAAAASAQENTTPTSWTYRVRVGDEVTATRANAQSPFLGPTTGSLWDGLNQVVASADGTWTQGDRLQTGAGVAVVGATGRDAAVRIRQVYARVSATSWLDVEAGKRIVRWGTGYAFTPTGLLDPPRSATDPQDRLSVNEGMALVQATAFRGDTALTIAAAAPNGLAALADPSTRLFAAKLRTAIRGFEFALVGSAADGRRLSAGANFTLVVGDRLEWHGEFLIHDRTSPWMIRVAPDAIGARATSALIGLQYTSASGVNIVLEGYRDGNGLDSPAWQRLVSGARNPLAVSDASPTELDVAHGERVEPRQAQDGRMPRPSRRHFAFVRAARAASDARWKPELMAIVGVDDGSVTIVPTSGWNLRDHVDVYVRGVALAGARRSEARDAPIRGAITVGLAVRY